MRRSKTENNNFKSTKAEQSDYRKAARLSGKFFSEWARDVLNREVLRCEKQRGEQ